MEHITCFVTDEETPRARLAVLLEHFSHLEDEREPWRVMYPLSEMLLLLTCTTIAPCDDLDQIAASRLLASATTVRCKHAKACLLGRASSGIFAAVRTVSFRHSQRALAAHAGQPRGSDPVRALF